MNILYIYAHPNPVSFNALLKDHGIDQLKNLGHDVILDDLYAQHFNPAANFSDFHLDSNELNQQYFLSQSIAFHKNALASDIVTEIEKIQWAERLIFQFPLWWFSVPAILKGWLDKVFVKGFAYDAGKTFETGLLKGKTAALVLTTQSPESAYQKTGVHEATIDVFLRPIEHTLRFVGIKVLPHFVIFDAFNFNAERKEQIISDYQNYLYNTVF